MIKLFKHGYKLFTPVEYFTLDEWNFQRSNFSDLVKNVKMLNDSDIVKLKLHDMNWE